MSARRSRVVVVVRIVDVTDGGPARPRLGAGKIAASDGFFDLTEPTWLRPARMSSDFYASERADAFVILLT